MLVLCTVSEDGARPLVDALLEEHLIACANLIGPVTSRYHWQGAVEEDRETVLLLKTTEERAGTLRQRIAELHPYDVPEVLEVGVDGGLPEYLGWVAECCRPPGGGAGP